MKSCPACSQQVIVISHDPPCYVAKCQNIECRMTGPERGTEEEAINTWNALPRHEDTSAMPTGPWVDAVEASPLDGPVLVEIRYYSGMKYEVLNGPAVLLSPTVIRFARIHCRTNEECNTHEKSRC